jgi:hypothetical protein
LFVLFSTFQDSDGDRTSSAASRERSAGRKQMTCTVETEPPRIGESERRATGVEADDESER